MYHFQQNVDPLQEDGNNGIEHYLNTLVILEIFFDSDLSETFLQCLYQSQGFYIFDLFEQYKVK